MSQAEYNPCAGCQQGCCSNYTVIVTGYDAWLIATRLRLAMEQFLIFFPSTKNTPSDFILERSGARFNIALAGLKDEAYERHCVFWLNLPDGYNRCGIYPIRPIVCQVYPAFIGDGIVHLRNDVLCPPRAWNLTSMALPVWRENLWRFQVEHDIYNYVVESWRQYVETAAPDEGFPINVYYSYLIAVYGRLEQVRQAMSAEAAKSILHWWNESAERHINPLMNTSAHDTPTGCEEFVSELRRVIDNVISPAVIEGHPPSYIKV
jgi:Fe-S-cluster containining protein